MAALAFFALLPVKIFRPLNVDILPVMDIVLQCQNASKGLFSL